MGEATPAGDFEAGDVEAGTPPARRRRRWPWIIAGTILALAGVAAFLWFIWLPAYRPGLRAGERYGIDVSNHQGEIDWKRVAADDIEFAYIKATEGGDFTDARFAQNWEAAAAAGLDHGAYHFFTLCTPGNAQARHFLSVVPPGSQALPPAVDLELAGNCAARPSNEAVRRELADFLEIVEGAVGQQTILYVGDDFERRYPVRETLDRLLWHRRVLRRPNVDGWIIWQVMGHAQVAGVDGDVDLNVMRSRP